MDEKVTELLFRISFCIFGTRGSSDLPKCRVVLCYGILPYPHLDIEYPANFDVLITSSGG